MVQLKVGDEIIVYGTTFVLVNFELKHDQPPRVEFKTYVETLKDSKKQE